MAPFVKRAIKISLGWILLLVGVVGLALPVLHGTFFFVAGLLILSTEYEWAHNLLSRVKTRFPRVGRVIEAAERKFRSWIHFRHPQHQQPDAAD